MEGYEVVTMEDAAPRADIFVTATGNVDVITVDHMRAMKDRAIVCNIGHFDSEIQVGRAEEFQMAQCEAAGGRSGIPRRQAHHSSVGRPAGQSGQCHGPSQSFVMSASFTNQTLAQIELFANPGKYQKKVYTLPKQLDEKVARLHLAKIGVQADRAFRQAIRLHQYPQGRPLQAGHLSILIGGSAAGSILIGGSVAGVDTDRLIPRERARYQMECAPSFLVWP